MPLTTLRIELPAYSHSFHVPVNPATTVLDVKQEIAKVCPGSPNPSGQRLVWRGRFLRDEETLECVFKSPDATQVVHLAVHPSAWTSSPPNISPAESTSTPPTPQPARRSASQFIRSPPSQQLPNTAHVHPLPSFAYMQYLHSLSLAVLSGGTVPLPTVPTVNELESWRSAAQSLYRSRSWPWPSIYDEPFPSGSPERGVKYEAVMLEGLPYLRLTPPDGIPTAAQQHALQILTHTFAILSVAHDPAYYAPLNPYPSHPYAPPTNVNQLLQQVGLPALRLAPNQVPNANPPDANPLAAPGAAGPDIRAIPLRAFVVPLVMLTIRTVLLMYFFSPAKRPVFGIVLSLWILYEAWTALRVVLHEGGDRDANEAAANAGAAAGAAGRAPPAGAAGGPNVPGLRPTAGRSNVHAILDRLATMNLSAEDAMLDTDRPIINPGLAQKARMFVTLFFMTLYPAAWDRRRTALRRREGRIRTEAHAREAPPPPEPTVTEGEGQAPAQSAEDAARARTREQMIARHERRPAWLRGYVQRVVDTEWVDDP